MSSPTRRSTSACRRRCAHTPAAPNMTSAAAQAKRRRQPTPLAGCGPSLRLLSQRTPGKDVDLIARQRAADHRLGGRRGHPGEHDSKRRSHPDAAIHEDCSARPLDDPVDGRQANAVPGRLGREVRLEDVLLGLGVHPAPVVHDRQDDRGRADRLVGARLAQLDAHQPAGGDRLGGVDAEVEHDLLELGRIDRHEGRLGGRQMSSSRRAPRRRRINTG